MTETPETLNTPAAEETIEAKVSRLEAIIETNQTRGWGATVEMADGTTKTVKEITEENRRYLDEIALTTERLKRENDIREAQVTAYVTPENQIGFRAPFLTEKPIFATEDAARDFVGRNKWNSFTAQQRGQLRTLTVSDVAKHDPKQYFGKDSSSRKSTELMRESPALYALLKERAKKEGIA